MTSVVDADGYPIKKNLPLNSTSAHIYESPLPEIPEPEPLDPVPDFDWRQEIDMYSESLESLDPDAFVAHGNDNLTDELDRWRKELIRLTECFRI